MTRSILVAAMSSMVATMALAGDPGEPEAACCFGDVCHMLTEDACLNEGGIWLPNQICETVTCSMPNVGACCFPDGGCAMLPEDHCLAEGGDWQGEGSDCASTCGGTEDAACCIEFVCLMLSEQHCAAEGGHWYAGTHCNEVVCKEPPAYGACCFDTPAGLMCVEMHEMQCFGKGGEWHGPNTTCDEIACGPGGGDGACCINGGCLMLTPDECDSVHGQLNDGACGDVQCAPWCEGDIDGDGMVGVNDILILLANWGPCA